MRAAVFKGPDQPWQIETVPDPVPRAGEAVIKVGRCGLCGTDISMTSGKGHDYPCGMVPGHEYAGEVVALGPDVERLKLGDKVTAMPAIGCGECADCRTGEPFLCSRVRSYFGGFGEYLRISERAAVVLPDALSIADGAVVEPLAVGLHGVALAKIRPGEKILVLGTGSIGLAVIHWARRLGAGRILAASRSGSHAAEARHMGADDVISLGDDDKGRIAESLGGNPDVVFECAGAPGILAKSVSLVRKGGRVISLGFCMTPDPIIPGQATYKQVTITFSLAYSLAEFRHVADTLDAGWGGLSGFVSDTIGLAELPARVTAIRAGSGGIKLHVNPGLG